MIERRSYADAKIHATGPDQQSPVFVMPVCVSNYRIQNQISGEVPLGSLNCKRADKQFIQGPPDVLQRVPGLPESLTSIIPVNGCRKHFIAMAQFPDTSRKGFRR